MYLCDVEVIKFEWLGLHLQEPMALIMNWLISAFCFFAYFKLRKFVSEANYYWRLFYLSFGISTFFGGLGHIFFEYLGIFGKYPSWTFGTLSNCFAALGMLNFKNFSFPKNYANWIVWVKGAVMLALALITQKFVFVAVDAIITYIGYTGIYAFFMLKTRNAQFLKQMVIAVLILLPSAFIFLLKINVNRWLNKDDLSHILMLVCIYYFYLGLKEWGQKRHVYVKE